ncbi:sensor histidine kinase, partial [Phytoactinopolyspora endophytica]|uniref:sensor histidine kinase n=1 Tax=Phytoactinopolyspora endophytica TaxID=1642495 RepID=UPI0030B81A3D
AAYFVATESLTNAAKHSDATHCNVTVTLELPAGVSGGPSDDGEGGRDRPSAGAAVLAVRVSDDGRGGAHLGKGHGLTGLADRLAGVDGQLAIDSPPGAGTTIAATIPLP